MTLGARTLLALSAMFALSACAAPTLDPGTDSPAVPITAPGSTAYGGPVGGLASEPGPAAASTAQAPATPGTPAAPATAGAARTPAPVTISFAGDVHFERHVAALLRRPDGLAELRPLLGAADISIVNLETSITTRGTAQPKQFTFRAPPSALDTLAAAGVDVVGMANNHAVDFGPVGLTDTLAAKDASPVPVIGIGTDAAAAFAPAVIDVRGTSVAVIASTQYPDFTARTFPAADGRPGVAVNVDNTRLVAAVRAARSRFDVVVVFLHWGTERQNCPDAAQFATAAALERAGADVIVGGHQHRVLGAGWLGRAYVGYGLGNFIWWLKTKTDADAASGVLTVEIDPALVAARAAIPRDRWPTLSPVVRSARYAPLTISAVDGIPRPAVAPAARLAAWEAARACTTLRGTP